jgi:hypothetical protein
MRNFATRNAARHSKWEKEGLVGRIDRGELQKVDVGLY